MLLLSIFLTLVYIGITAFLYRCGGMSKEEAKQYHIPTFLAKSWIRDWLCTLFNYLVLLTWWQPNNPLKYLWFIPTYLLTGFAFSSYWSRLFKGEDNFFAHGLFLGLASFPLYWAGIHIYAILINAIFSSVLMGWLCLRTGNVFKEEFGRGGISAATRLLLLC